MLFGLVGVAAQFVEVPAVLVALGRVVCSSLLLLIIAAARKDSLRLNSGKDYCMIILTGAVMAIHWTTFFQSIQVSTVAIGTITFSTFPLFLTFIEPIVFHEKLRSQSVLSAVLLLIGVIITIPEFSMANHTTIGIIWGMVSSLSYAVLTLANRYFSPRYAARTVCLYEQGSAAVVLLPALFLVETTWRPLDLVRPFPVCVRPKKRESSDRRNHIRNGNRLWNLLRPDFSGRSAKRTRISRRSCDIRRSDVLLNESKIKQQKTALLLIVYQLWAVGSMIIKSSLSNFSLPNSSRPSFL